MSPLKVCVFGGTSTSLEVCKWLQAKAVDFRLCVATDTGLEAAHAYKQHIRVGRMDEEAMGQWLSEEQFSLIIDAAHPYAEILHSTALSSADKFDIPVVRYDRESPADQFKENPYFHPVESAVEACAKIAELRTEKVLLTTGSKDLNLYKNALPLQKLYARVLPNLAAMEICSDLNFQLDEIIALKGPFTADFNRALYSELGVDTVVTKESGAAGGFIEKVIPCLDLKRHCVVITRPKIESDRYFSVVYTCSELESLLSL